jgi:hypothetical protein
LSGQNIDGYYQALGHFVSTFSEIERLMQGVLWACSKMSLPVAKAVLAQIRTEDASAKIAKIGVAENWSADKTARWQEISSRLGLIREFRNDILHYGATWQGGDEWLISNKDLIHARGRLVHTPVSIKTLEDATADLEKLMAGLFNFGFEDSLPEEARRVFAEALTHAWRYKPPPQAGGQGKPPDGAPKPRRQRPPSSASRRKAALERSKSR